MDLPALTDRTGTPDDVANCIAIFGSDKGETMRLSTLKLPAPAIPTDENGIRYKVIVIQDEYAFKRRTKLVGYIIPGQSTGIATPEEVDFID